MNKKLLLITTLLAASLPWLGCNKSGKLNDKSTFKTPTGPVELKVKWSLHERVVQDLDMKMTMEMAIPGQPAPMKQDMTMGQAFGMTVLQATPDGGHEVEMDFISARMASKLGEKTLFDYDSEKKAPADKANPVADVFGKIVGTKIQFFLDASNAVERVEGVDALTARLTTGAQAEAMAPIKGMYNEGYFKQMMSANQFLPPHAVQPGDTWPVRMEIPMATMGTMVMAYEVTLQSWEMHGKRNCARMEFQGTIQTKPDPAVKPGAMSISILEGNTSGVAWFDPDLGITIDTKMTQDLKMVIRVPMPARGAAAPQMQGITNQMSQVMTIKLESVK